MENQFKREIEERFPDETRIKVIGVGGGGGLFAESLMDASTTGSTLSGVEAICADTDAAALKRSRAHKLIQLGADAGGAARTPDDGRRAAEVAQDDIRAALQGAHMVFVMVVLGGNTGTAAAPVIARLAKAMGILTVVAVVTQPFGWSEVRSMTDADAYLAQLEESADTVIVMRYAQLLEMLGGGVAADEVLAYANAALKNLVRDTVAMLHPESLVCVDLWDVRTVLGKPGLAMMATGYAQGVDRARVAAEHALASPPLSNHDLSRGKGVLVFISRAQGGFKWFSESKSAMNVVRAGLGPEADVIFGVNYDEELGDAIRVTVIATGLFAHRD